MLLQYAHRLGSTNSLAVGGGLLLAFGCFAVVGQLAFVSGNTFEYRLYGVQFPFVAFVLLTFMVVSSGLLWANYRDEDFRGAEQVIYGFLFSLSTAGFMVITV